jgi:linoleoyl-CoA desaturase
MDKRRPPQENSSTFHSKPTFPAAADKDIFKTLREEVKGVVSILGPKRKNEVLLKAILFPLVYVLVYCTALFGSHNSLLFYGCYFVLGLLIVMIFLNIIHDAVHGAIFKRGWLNNGYVYLFDLLGANSFIWKQRHVRFHHNYPNVNGWDTDIEQSPLFRVFPDGPYAAIHKYQHIYLPLLYPFYLANWLLVRDFKDFFNRHRTVRQLIDIPSIEYAKLFFFKAIFFFYMIVLPKIVLGIPWWQCLTAFAILLFTASIFSLLVLLSPHANTESQFPLPDEQSRLPYNWMEHMMLTTNDITNDNFFTRFFMGCFNYHVAHHLFPNINHVYYPEITQCLKRYAQQYQLPYREYSLLTSLRNHYRLLKQNRIPESIFEETM